LLCTLIDQFISIGRLTFFAIVCHIGSAIDAAELAVYFLPPLVADTRSAPQNVVWIDLAFNPEQAVVVVTPELVPVIGLLGTGLVEICTRMGANTLQPLDVGIGRCDGIRPCFRIEPIEANCDSYNAAR